MRTDTKRRLARLERAARAEAPEVRIAGVDEQGAIVGSAPIVPVKRDNAYTVPYVDYRAIFRGSIYADDETQA